MNQNRTYDDSFLQRLQIQHVGQMEPRQQSPQRRKKKGEHGSRNAGDYNSQTVKVETGPGYSQAQAYASQIQNVSPQMTHQSITLGGGGGPGKHYISMNSPKFATGHSGSIKGVNFKTNIPQTTTAGHSKKIYIHK